MAIIPGMLITGWASSTTMLFVGLVLYSFGKWILCGVVIYLVIVISRFNNNML